MAGFETFAAYSGFALGVLNGGVGLIVAWRGSKGRERQRLLRRELRTLLIDVRGHLEEAINTVKMGDEIISDPPASLQNMLPELKKLKGELKAPKWGDLDAVAASVIHASGMWKLARNYTELHTRGGVSEQDRRARSAQDSNFVEMATDAVNGINGLLATVRRIDNGNLFVYLAHR